MFNIHFVFWLIRASASRGHKAAASTQSVRQKEGQKTTTHCLCLCRLQSLYRIYDCWLISISHRAKKKQFWSSELQRPVFPWCRSGNINHDCNRFFCTHTVWFFLHFFFFFTNPIVEEVVKKGPCKSTFNALIGVFFFPMKTDSLFGQVRQLL